MNSTARNVFAWLRTIISLLFLAYLGNMQLRAGFLAIAFANITGYPVIFGLAMGMKFLCHQANQANELSVTRITVQKFVLILLCAALPIGLLWINMEGILLWCGQEEIIAKMAGVYITFSIPVLLAQAFLHPLRIYLTIQNSTDSVTCSEALALLLYITFNLVLVQYLDLGIAGVSLATVWSSLFMVFYLVAHLLVKILWELLVKCVF